MSNHRAVEIAEKLNRAGVVTKWTGVRTASRNLASVILLVALVVGGIIALLVFWSQLLKPGDLSSVSLPLVALAAGVAATFNPCSLPALPGFLAVGASDDGTLRMRDRSGLSLSASLGAMTVIIVFGIIVAFAGKESKELISPYFRWVQLGVGLSLVGLAVLHITGQTNRIPLVGAIMGVGSRMWQGSMGKPTARNGYLFGAGFVAVGAGWTVPFLAAVAVFAVSAGGFMTGLGAFLVFGITMGLLVFLLTFLGATAGVGLARSLRVWGRRIQLWAAIVIILIGAALVYSGINPGVFDRLILTSWHHGRSITVGLLRSELRGGNRMEAVRLSVPGITCAGWITTIRMAVSRLDGVDKISGDDKARTITVEHEPSSVAVDAIQQALESIGYDSTVIT